MTTWTQLGIHRKREAFSSPGRTAVLPSSFLHPDLPCCFDSSFA